MFSLPLARQLLARTPEVIRVLLDGLSDEWTTGTEGPDTWSPYDVVGHLIHGERSDWIPRARIILQPGGGTFEPFDRFAQFRESQGKSLSQLLDEFEAARRQSLSDLDALNVTVADLDKTATHPHLGTVTLKQLLATWVAHDLDHLMQISRVMGRQVTPEIGPWREYLRIAQI
jgi:hypothetical protein